MIKRIGPSKYVVMSKDGTKRLSKPTTKKGAQRRLGQIEHFKKQGAY